MAVDVETGFEARRGVSGEFDAGRCGGAPRPAECERQSCGNRCLGGRAVPISWMIALINGYYLPQLLATY